MFGANFADQPSQAPAAVDPATGLPVEDDDSIKDDVNTVILSLLPWIISILFHVGLVLLTVFMVWSTINRTEEDDLVIIPSVRLSATPGAPLSVKKVKKSSQSRKRSVSRNIKNVKTTLSNKVETKMIEIGAVGGAAGKSSPFGTTGSGDTGTKATMFGTGSNARRIVFVIDASGSLLDSMPFVINELKRSIGDLSVKQSFTVIFFQGDDAIEVPAPGLKVATPQTKQRVSQWIDVDSGNIIPHGRSNPVKAIRLALRYKPQLMFLLSDNITGRGQYELDQKRLLAEIDRANTSKTKINAIQFLYPDDLTRFGMKATLRLVSENTGGVYKFVDGRELGIQW